MNDLQASIGVAQVARIEDFQRKRSEIAKIYMDELGHIDEITLPKARGNTRPAWHLFPLLISFEKFRINRDSFINALKSENIGTSVHFIPVHLHPFYQKRLGYRLGDLPHSEYLFQHEISLPIYPKMRLKDAIDVAAAIRKLLNYFRK